MDVTEILNTVLMHVLEDPALYLSARCQYMLSQLSVCSKYMHKRIADNYHHEFSPELLSSFGKRVSRRIDNHYEYYRSHFMYLLRLNIRRSSVSYDVAVLCYHRWIFMKQHENSYFNLNSINYECILNICDDPRILNKCDLLSRYRNNNDYRSPENLVNLILFFFHSNLIPHLIQSDQLTMINLRNVQPKILILLLNHHHPELPMILVWLKKYNFQSCTQQFKKLRILFRYLLKTMTLQEILQELKSLGNTYLTTHAEKLAPRFAYNSYNFKKLMNKN